MDAPESAIARDEDLRRRLAAGDDAALGEVYDLYAPLVFGLARRVTADAEAAHDVTQEVFIGLWERPLAFDPERGSLRTWLAMITHRRAVDWIRRESRWRRPPPLADPEQDAVAPGVEDDVVASEVARGVKRSLDDLPPPLRDVIELAYYQGLSYREVAVALNIPEGTAKSRIRSALARLGQGLERAGLRS